jgi:thiosulfate/3-mercaptopyruvate sulfurtransferase
MFNKIGVSGNEIVMSCGSSVSASSLALAYSLINDDYMAKIYIGSWAEYGKK